jgi:hypothetical protein
MPTGPSGPSAVSTPTADANRRIAALNPASRLSPVSKAQASADSVNLFGAGIDDVIHIPVRDAGEIAGDDFVRMGP